MPRGNWVPGGGSYRCSDPHPLPWHLQTMRSRGRAAFPSVLFFVISLARIIFLGTGLRGKGEVACRRRADSGQETWIKSPLL